MSALAIFSFENSKVRTLGTAETPLFVAIDVAAARGYSQPAKSVNDRVDHEDIIKAEIETKGGRQTCQGCVGSLPDRVPRSLRSFPSPALHRNPRKGLRCHDRLRSHG